MTLQIAVFAKLCQRTYFDREVYLSRALFSKSNTINLEYPPTPPNIIQQDIILFNTTQHHPTSFIITNYNPSTPITIYPHPSPPIITYSHSTQLTTFPKYSLSPFISHHHSPALINHIQLYSIATKGISPYSASWIQMAVISFNC